MSQALDLSAASLASLCGETCLRRALWLDECDSTNTRALDMIARNDAGEFPLLICAARQTAGRGRGTNTWWSEPGALTCSLVVDTTQYGLPDEVRPLVSLLVGLSLLETARAELPRANFAVKWPNDVFLEDRKLAGILVEVPPQRANCLVIGIGWNINNTLADAPEALQHAAISLRDAAEQSFDRRALLKGLLDALDAELRSLARGELDLPGRWNAHCLLTGRAVTIRTGPRVVRGVCRGIDRDGALLVATATSVERLFGGIVENWE